MELGTSEHGHDLRVLRREATEGPADRRPFSGLKCPYWGNKSTRQFQGLSPCYKLITSKRLLPASPSRQSRLSRLVLNSLCDCEWLSRCWDYRFACHHAWLMQQVLIRISITKYTFMLSMFTYFNIINLLDKHSEEFKEQKAKWLKLLFLLGQTLPSSRGWFLVILPDTVYHSPKTSRMYLRKQIG